MSVFEPIYQIELDGHLLVDEPEAWQDLISEIVRYDDLHGILLSNKATLNFSGDGYRYIECKFNSSSFCNEIALVIREQCAPNAQFVKIVDGIIRNADCKFFMNKCTVQTAFEDNSYFARIKVNKDIKLFPNVPKSKNGNAIATALPVNVKLFDPITGTYPVFGGITYRKAYRIYELLKFATAFVSDGDIDFASDYFDTGEFKELLVTNGKHVSTIIPTEATDTNIGSYSFQEIIDEAYKFGNIGFALDTRGVKPILRVEPADYFYGNAVTDVLNFANGVVKKVKTDQLYAIIGLGSTETISDVLFLSYPEEIPFLGFNSEEFHLVGRCNTETKLDLKGEWVRSSNTIQYTFMNPDSSRDDLMFYISATKTLGLNYDAKQWDIFSTGAVPFYYNGDLTNDKIAARFLRAVPNSIAAFLGNGQNDVFLATRTADEPHPAIGPSLVLSPALFDDDTNSPNHDVNNRYGNGTSTPVSAVNSRYTAIQGGFYRLVAEQPISLVLADTDTCRDNGADVELGYTNTFFGPPFGFPYVPVVGNIVSTTGVYGSTGIGKAGIIICATSSVVKIRMLTPATPFIIGDNLQEEFSGGGTGLQALVNAVTAIPPAVFDTFFRMRMRRYDSANTLIETQVSPSQMLAVNGTVVLFLDHNFILNTSDYVIVEEEVIQVDSTVRHDINVLHGGYFTCIATTNGGGQFQQYNPEDFKAIQYEFDYPISIPRFRNIMQNSQDMLGFNIDGSSNITPWIQNMKYSRKSKMAHCVLLGTQVITPANCGAGFELREDGSIELRETSSDKELRE